MSKQVEDSLTARKQAEEALRREKEFAENLLESAQVIVLILDSVGRIVRFNSYLEEISGYRVEDVQGKEVHHLLAGTRAKLHASKILTDLARRPGA